ncbi:hypothetical protein SAMN05216454_11425 [Peptostreptococcus russellii]|uniref:Phage protein n=1 Tax=Peptostreptococcus russellii TaxID=215200 RepID=A0A1H8JHJ4_9FIRM|nr:hypothetical protein [Peptostreptococcus russellii]SEN80323.1 hypothetical protein SAMN05216454_11425 [Peptostreptococcus russellii]
MNRVRKAIELLYGGRCDVYEYDVVKDEKTKRKTNKEVLKHSNIPCRLSFADRASGRTIQKEMGHIEQGIKLFLSPDIFIKPNSKIIVTQNGRTVTYKNSTPANFHTNHQEINLELAEEYA